MKYIYRLYADKRYISTVVEVPVIKALDAVALDMFGGFTRYDTIGGYTSLDGEQMMMPALVYEVGCDSQEDIRRFAHVMRYQLSQDCVMVIRFQADVELVFEDFVREPTDVNGAIYED